MLAELSRVRLNIFSVMLYVKLRQLEVAYIMYML